MPRLKQRYEDEIKPALKAELGLDSVMQVPQISKITLNMGVGEAKTDAKALDAAIEELTTIAGQRAQVRKARKSIASFKLREGMSVGARVTLRGARMYEFLDRLVSIALPRIRDFRGLSPDSFDGRGNYSLGIREQIIFPEIDYYFVAGDRGPRHRDHDDGRDRRAGAGRSCARSGCRSPQREGTERDMAKTSLPREAEAPAQALGVSAYTRCNRCGRPRAVFRRYKLCRICLRELAHEGAIPGMARRARGDGISPRALVDVHRRLPQAEADGIAVVGVGVTQC